MKCGRAINICVMMNEKTLPHQNSICREYIVKKVLIHKICLIHVWFELWTKKIDLCMDLSQMIFEQTIIVY